MNSLIGIGDAIQILAYGVLEGVLHLIGEC